MQQITPKKLKNKQTNKQTNKPTNKKHTPEQWNNEQGQ